MTQQTHAEARTSPQQAGNDGRLRVGVDIVQVSGIRASIEAFGDRFTRRFFTGDEVAYAHTSETLAAERLAARFAAKEAAIKAFGLSEVGIDWRDIEVCKHTDGSCSLALHRKVAAHVRPERFSHIALSLSHDGDYATAMVAAMARPPLSH